MAIANSRLGTLNDMHADTSVTRLGVSSPNARATQVAEAQGLDQAITTQMDMGRTGPSNKPHSYGI